MSHPELLKSSSNSPPRHPKGFYYRFFDGGEEEKLEIFPLHHHQKTCERGFF